tara:strand:- start:519 stop:1091 length:573 start_codon:yes stop_codon:yes gene_type:complete
MSGIVGSRFNIRGSGLVGSLGTDGQVFTSSGAGKSAVFEAAGGMPEYWSTTAFNAYLDSNQSISTQTQTTVTLAHERFDTGSNFDTSTYTYTVPSTGYYYIAAGIGGDAMANSQANEVWAVVLIGGGNAMNAGINSYANPGRRLNPVIGKIHYCNQNDAILLQAYVQDSSGSPEVNGNERNTFLCGYRVY